MIADGEAGGITHSVQSVCTFWPCPMQFTLGIDDLAAAVKSYEGRVVRYSDELETQLRTLNGKPVNASDWFNWFRYAFLLMDIDLTRDADGELPHSFDVMGDLTFGQSFEGLKKQRTHWAITSIHESNAALGILGPIPWLIHLMMKLPNFLNPMFKLLKFSE